MNSVKGSTPESNSSQVKSADSTSALLKIVLPIGGILLMLLWGIPTLMGIASSPEAFRQWFYASMNDPVGTQFGAPIIIFGAVLLLAGVVLIVEGVRDVIELAKRKKA